MDNKFLVALTVFVVARILWTLRPAKRDPALDATDLVTGTKVLVAAIGKTAPMDADVEAYARFYKNVDRREFHDQEDCLEALASAPYQIVQLLTAYPLEADAAQRIFRACGSTEVRLISLPGQDADLARFVPKGLNCLLVIDGQGELWDAFLLDFLQRVAVHGRHLVEAFGELDAEGNDSSSAGQTVRSPFLDQVSGSFSFLKNPFKRRVSKLTPGGVLPLALFVRSRRDVALLP